MLAITEKCAALAALISLIPLAFGKSQVRPETSTGFPPCDAVISAGLGDRVLLATSDEYESRVQSWWAANARLRPWCLVQPHTAQEVSTAVTALSSSGRGAGDWHIAVRGGGHGPSGVNNIDNGVTIDLGMMNSSLYNSDSGLARVEPGAAWKDVYRDLLDNGNVTATGGRDGDVGVGGYLLGGGMSYYTGNNGFGCDEVVNFEVVLANGSIVNANSDENPSLWKALKGGGFNFGIVTAFDLRAMPAVDLAYGQSVISSAHSEEVVDGIVEFTNHPQSQSDDALIALFTHDAEINPVDDMTIILIRTNAQGNLNTTSFDNLTGIPTFPGTNSTWYHVSHAAAAEDSQIPAGYKTTQKTLTLPNNPDILTHAVSTLHTNLITTLTQTHSLPPSTFTTQFILQPFPSYLHTISASKGGNMLPPTSADPNTNSILFVAGISLTNTSSDAALAIAEAELSSALSALETEYETREFVYMNYASPEQDPLGSYGRESVGFMKDVAGEFDPEGFWQEMVPGGFKIGRVG